MKSIFIASLLIFLFLPFQACDQPALRFTEELVALIRPVDSILHNELKAILTSPDSNNYLIFDARSFEAFNVSHIASAVQLDSEISPERFIENHGRIIKNKYLVLYCSVGYSSSASVNRLREVAIQAGAHSIVNLRGGIFRWYNEKHPVVNEGGLTDEIHPYSSIWKVMIDER